MQKLPRVRIITAGLHALLFVTAALLLLFYSDGRAILERPAGVSILILGIADFPISLFAGEWLFFHTEYAKLVWSLWGAIGTIWWYFLGLSIEAWIKRFSKNS